MNYLCRLQGIVASMSRFPTFRRRFNNLIKALYLEAIQTGALDQADLNSNSRDKISKLIYNNKEMQKKGAEDSDGPSKLQDSSERV